MSATFMSPHKFAKCEFMPPWIEVDFEIYVKVCLRLQIALQIMAAATARKRLVPLRPR
jgi:hypothetical protein